MTFLDEMFSVRLRRKELESIMTITKKEPEKYTSISHFIRVAVVKEIRKNKEVKTK